MQNSRTLPLLALCVLAAAGSHARPAAAETNNCINITSLPAVISTQGVYCLKQNVTSSLATGAAISVTVNNVTLDCNDFKIGNLAAGPSTQAVGILANQRLNIIVRNCGIRGFLTGVALTNGDYRVLQNRFDNNLQTAIFVGGDGSAVRGNEIIDTGGSTVGGIDEFQAVLGDGDIDVIDNTVNGVFATGDSDGSAYGIRTLNMSGGTISGNRVRNLAPDGSGAQRGIWNETGSRVTVSGNTVVMGGGLLGADVGIRCGDGLLLNGASRDNTVLGTGVIGEVLGLVNCVPAGGDFVNPL